MQFHVGDNVMVPGTGLGRVEAIEKLSLGGPIEELMRVALDDGTIWVPTARLDERRIRTVMTQELVDEVWTIIRETEAPEIRANWNQRQRRYNEMLMDNRPRILASLLGELASVKQGKPLSFGEKRLYTKVREILTAEIASVLGTQLDVVATRMDAEVDAVAAAA